MCFPSMVIRSNPAMYLLPAEIRSLAMNFKTSFIPSKLGKKFARVIVKLMHWNKYQRVSYKGACEITSERATQKMVATHPLINISKFEY